MGKKSLFDDEFNSLQNIGETVYICGNAYLSRQVRSAAHHYTHSLTRNPQGKVLSYRKMSTGDHRVMLEEFKG